jgi:hypothetical protein
VGLIAGRIFTRTTKRMLVDAFDEFRLIAGWLPSRQERLVLAWAEVHQRRPICRLACFAGR